MQELIKKIKEENDELHSTLKLAETYMEISGIIEKYNAYNKMLVPNIEMYLTQLQSNRDLVIFEVIEKSYSDATLNERIKNIFEKYTKKGWGQF